MIRVDQHIYTGRPNPTGRAVKEMAVYDLLGELRIPYERVDHDPAMTIDDCSLVERALGVDISKNLFLCNVQKTRFYLLLMPGDKVFKTRDLSAQIGGSRLSFAGPEYMEEFLNITPGSVSILGLMNDLDHRVRLLMDEEVAQASFIGCHPCVNTSSLKIRTSDITDIFLPRTGHELTVVQL